MLARNKIKQALEDFTAARGIKEDYSLSSPEEVEFGDYATNLALVSFTAVNEEYDSALDWAKVIAEELDSRLDNITAQAAAPGFVNFRLQSESLLKLLEATTIAWQPGAGKTVVIDYSAPNVAKPFGIGHLRSTIIGQALYNLYDFLGYETVGDNHLGDWGTQFGQLIYQIQEKDQDSQKLSIAQLEQLYVEFHRRAEEQPEIKEEARELFRRLEQGDKKMRQIWQDLVDLSLEEYDRVYQLLGVDIDYTLGESFYQDKMPTVIKDAQEAGLLKESQGAQVIEIPGMSVPAMLIKSDGATTYLLRDLATIKYRMDRWQPDKIIYEVGADHKFHFRQLFQAAVMLGYIERKKLVHVAHGMIRDLEGKFSTRQGRTIHLKEVLEEAVEQAEELAGQTGTARDLTKNEQEQIARAVGIGAVKYNDLRQNPTTNIVFDWDKMLTLEGNSGPYLQYTYARLCQLLSKGEEEGLLVPEKEKLDFLPEYQPVKAELSVLRVICHFEEAIQTAARNFAPNLLAEYLYKLARGFNYFYQECRVIEEEQPEQSQVRLRLVELVAEKLGRGLELLGLERLEKM